MLSAAVTILLLLVLHPSESPVPCTLGTSTRQSGYYWMSITKSTK